LKSRNSSKIKRPRITERKAQELKGVTRASAIKRKQVVEEREMKAAAQLAYDEERTKLAAVEEKETNAKINTKRMTSTTFRNRSRRMPLLLPPRRRSKLLKQGK